KLDADAAELETAMRVRIEGMMRTLERRGLMQLGAWRAMLSGLSTATPEEFVDWFSIARSDGHEIDVDGLSAALGVPVVPLIARDGEGVEELKAAIKRMASERGSQNARKPELAPADAGPLASSPPGSPAHWPSDARRSEPRSFQELPEAFGREASAIRAQLAGMFPHRDRLASAEALLILSDDKVLAAHPEQYPPALRQAVAASRTRLEASGVDWRSAAIEARYARVSAIAQHVTVESFVEGENFSDRVDRVLTHRVWGLLVFVGIMLSMFVSIFVFAQLPMDALDAGVGWLADQVGSALGAGDLQDLLANGVIKGVGAVVVFLPQICLLFLFISLLEDTGYMARAAFLMDRLMSRVGLHGKSFIPMLSSFACAIPGIMATRTIESPKDRLVTILIAPLMSCSARLPVYTVLIAACVGGGVLRRGMVLTAMYLLGIVGALGMAWIFKRTLLKGEPPPLIFELPPYKRPVVKTVLRHMWDRSKLFLRRAGTVILGINVLLWFLVTYPKVPPGAGGAPQPAGGPVSQKTGEDAAKAVASGPLAGSPLRPDETPGQVAALKNERSGDQLRYSFAGRLGHMIEPAIRPLGFDWKIGIGIVASFAAREVFVSTMSVVYNVGEVDAGDRVATAGLAETLRGEKREDGTRVYTALTGITLMVFYVFAMQCVSTIAIVGRETNSWKWPLFQFAYMTALAWCLAFITYQGGKFLGF
ncbi:MAG: ferrous iron transport protein B, partial [Verrucomicrobiota bacterium]